MTQPPRERIRLDACQEGDVVHIAHGPNGSWKTLGRVQILKIKPLAKAGRVQIKCRADGDPRATVRKLDFAGDLTVERIDTAAELAVAEHAGVSYIAPQGGDPKEILAQALEAEVLTLPGNGSTALVGLIGQISALTKRKDAAIAQLTSTRTERLLSKLS